MDGPAGGAARGTGGALNKRWLLRALGPALLVVVLLRLPQPELFREVLARALGWELGLAVLLNFVVVALKVLRWQRVLAARGIRYSYRRAWNAFNAASYLALLTPGRVGDLLRVGYLRRDLDTPAAEGVASVVVDRLFDLALVMGMAALGVVRFGSLLAGAGGVSPWLFVILAAGACLAFLLLASTERFLKAIVEKVAGRGEPADAVARFFGSARVQLKGAASTALPLTLVSYLITYGQAVLLARAVGIPLSFLDVVALCSLSMFFGLFPVSVSGVGVREALFAMLFPALGFPASAGVAYGLLIFGVMYLTAAAYGFVVWQTHPLVQSPAVAKDAPRE